MDDLPRAPLPATSIMLHLPAINTALPIIAIMVTTGFITGVEDAAVDDLDSRWGHPLGPAMGAKRKDLRPSRRWVVIFRPHYYNVLHYGWTALKAIAIAWLQAVLGRQKEHTLCAGKRDNSERKRMHLLIIMVTGC